MVLETYINLCMTELDFLGKIFLPQKLGKCASFLKFIEKFGHYFLLDLFYNENLLFALFLYRSHIWENFCSWDMGEHVLSQSGCRIFWSTVSPEQFIKIAWFFCMLIQIYIKVDQKIWGGRGQSWVWPVWSWDSKIDCTSRINGWSDFLHAGANSINFKFISLTFEWVWSKTGVATYLVHKTLKSSVS